MADPYRYRGYTWMALGSYEQARSDFDRAIEIRADYSEAYLGRGILRFREGKFADAVDDMDLAITFDPWNGTARYYKALACEKIGRLREAVEAYKGYIHCAVPGEAESVERARRRIEELERTHRR